MVTALFVFQFFNFLRVVSILLCILLVHKFHYINPRIHLSQILAFKLYLFCYRVFCSHQYKLSLQPIQFYGSVYLFVPVDSVASVVVS